MVQYCLLHLQKISKDLWLWLVCTFDLELININLLAQNFIKDLYILLLLGKFLVHIMQQCTRDE